MVHGTPLAPRRPSNDAPRRPSDNAPRRRRNDAARGAVLVEFAIVGILLFTLVFGIAEFGFHFNNYQSVRQGARDATRTAVVNNYPAGCSAGTATANLVCLVEREVGLTAADTYVKITIPDAGGAQTNRGTIRVCVSYRTHSITGFFPFLDGNYLTTRVEMRNEVGTAPVVTAYEDALPAGGSWGFCNA